MIRHALTMMCVMLVEPLYHYVWGFDNNFDYNDDKCAYILPQTPDPSGLQAALRCGAPRGLWNSAMCR